MPKINQLDMRFLDELFEMTGGYVLDFKDRTFAEFFHNDLSIDIDDEKYRRNGTSKGRRLRTLLLIENELVVAKTLRALWDYRDAIRGPFNDQDEQVQSQIARFFKIVHSMESAADV